MKNIFVALLLIAVFFSIASALPVTTATRISVTTIGTGAIPTATTKTAPFAEPTPTKSGNVTATADRSTGRVWMASAGDIVSPSQDVAEEIFRGTDTRATGTDRYETFVTVELPEAGYVRKGDGEVFVSVAIYNAAGNLVPLQGGGTSRLFGNPITHALDTGTGSTPNTRTFYLETRDVLPAGGIYYVKAGFRIRSDQGGIHALGGGTGSDLSKGVMLKKIILRPFYFG